MTIYETRDTGFVSQIPDQQVTSSFAHLFGRRSHGVAGLTAVVLPAAADVPAAAGGSLAARGPGQVSTFPVVLPSVRRSLIPRRPGNIKDLFYYLKKILLFFVLLWVVFPGLKVSAQFYEYGQDAGTIRWNQFSSENYRLIYPRGLDSLAMSFADKLEYFYPYQAQVLDHAHSKMPVIFHNESSFSNGVFVWAPKRVEIFTNPDPNGYPQDWLTQLALHEGRHAFQVSKLNQGFSKVLSFIAGEQALGIPTGMLPVWYLEGDAVDAETRFSYSGRGRLPSFEMRMKAILLERDDPFTYSKAFFGSYKDFIPNHYELGYLLVRYGRRTYGDVFWTDFEDYTARKPFLISPTFFSMRKYGVKSKQQFYLSALETYRSHWKKQLDAKVLKPVTTWSDTTVRHYTNYHFPQWINDSVIVALKTSLDHIPEFVTISRSGVEKRIFRPGFMNSGRFSYSDSLLVWDELIPDIRWSNRNFSLLRIYNMQSGRTWNLGSRTRYYSPALSGRGTRVAAIEQRTDHTFNVTVLDLRGNMLEVIPSPGGKYIQHPTWMGQDSGFIVTVNDQEGEYLYSYTFRDSSWNVLYHSGFADISHPVVENGNIYFSSTKSGTDNIYMLELGTGELSMVTSVAFGAMEPDVHPSGKLAFVDYHAGGYRAASLPDSIPLPFPEILQYPVEQLDAMPTDDERTIIEGSKELIPGDYDVKPYRKLSNAINIHSWLPLYFDYMNPEAALVPEDLPVSIGATILSQNLLSTVVGMLGYEYSDNIHYLRTGVRLKGRYPILDMSLDYGGYPLFYQLTEDDVLITRPNRLTFSANAYVPLRINTGKFITFFQPLAGYQYAYDVTHNEDLTGFEWGVHWMRYRMYATSYLRLGARDILPRLGIAAYIGYRHAPFNTDDFGTLASRGLTLYVPGPMKHQTIRLSYEAQVQDPVRFLLGNEIAIPRGIQPVQGLDLRVYRATLTTPLAYPDLAIEPVFYLKRIRASFWADYLEGRDVLVIDPEPELVDRNYFSYGADLLFDFHPVRIFFPFAMGARVSYVPETGRLVPELLFTIDVD